MAHGNPPSLPPILLLSSLSHPPLSALITCFYSAPNSVLLLSSQVLLASRNDIFEEKRHEERPTRYVRGTNIHREHEAAAGVRSKVDCITVKKASTWQAAARHVCSASS